MSPAMSPVLFFYRFLPKEAAWQTTTTLWESGDQSFLRTNRNATGSEYCRVRWPILENETICFCSEEEEERLYRCVENGELRNVEEILSSGKVRFDRKYHFRELICGEDRIRVAILRTACVQDVH